MNWYGVKILYVFRASSNNQILAGEESIQLIKANNLDEAELKAADSAMKNKYPAESDTWDEQKGKWCVQKIIDIFHMFENPEENIEVYSELLPHRRDVMHFLALYS